MSIHWACSSTNCSPASTPVDRQREPGIDIVELLRRIREDDPPRPSTRAGSAASWPEIALKRDCVPAKLFSTINGELDWIAMQALEKDRRRRYESPTALAQDIQNFLDDRPVSACPPSRMYLVRKWVRRNTILFTATCAVLAAILIGAAGVLYQWRDAVAARADALTKEGLAEASAEAERKSAYAATLASALAAREHHDFGQARRLLDGLAPGLRGFEWRMLRRLCDGDELRTIRFGEGRGAQPESLAWLPGREAYAVLTADARLHVHSAMGAEIEPPRLIPPPTEEQQHAQLIHHGLTYAPNGRRLAYAYGNILRVLDAETLAVLFEDASAMPQFGWLDDDRLLFGWNGTVVRAVRPGAWILNLRDGSRTPLPPELSAPLAVSPNRKFVAISALWENRSVRVYRTDELLSGQPIQTYSPGVDGDSINLMAIDSNGAYLACAAGGIFNPNLYLLVVNVSTGKYIFRQFFHSPVNSLAMHPSEPILAAAGEDASVRLFRFTQTVPPNGNSYDDGIVPAIREPVDANGPHDPPLDMLTRSAQEGRTLFLLGHEDRIFNVAFAPDGKSLATISADGTLRQWGLGALSTAHRIEFVSTDFFRAHPAASPDGRRVLYTNLQGATSLWELNGPGAQLPDNQLPVAVLSDGTFATLDRQTGQFVLWALDPAELGSANRARELWRIPGVEFIGEFKQIRKGVLSRDERFIVGAIPGQRFVVDLEKRTVVSTDDLVQQLGKHGVACHDVSPDGKWIAATGFGRQTAIYSVANIGTAVQKLGGERDFDTAVAFDPSGQKLYTGDQDGTVRVWDTGTWQELRELRWPAHSGAVTALAVSNDGKLIATSGDSTLKLWRAEPSAAAPNHELLSARVKYFSCNWIQIARETSVPQTGKDLALLFSAPFGTLDIWDADAESGK